MADKYLVAMTGERALVNRAHRSVILLTRRGACVYGKGVYDKGISDLHAMGKGWREVDEATWEKCGGLTGEIEEAAS